MADRVAYKVMTGEAFAGMRRAQAFEGSPADRADGFIHLSTAAQLTETVDRHYRGQPDLVVLAIDLEAVGADLRWEPSRGGALFPHVYGVLPMAAVLAAGPLERLEDGTVALPGEVR